MSGDSSFTGRRRRQATRPAVRVYDTLARLAISVGGVGTIIAVLGVSLFLVWVVLPLFMPARVDGEKSFAMAPLGGAVHVGVDEYRVLGWALLASGDMVSYRLDSGALRSRLAPLGQAPTAWSFPVGGEEAAVGFADGSVRLIRPGFTTTFVMPADLAAAAAAGDGAGERPDRVVDADDGAVAQLTPDGQYRVQSFGVEADEPFAAGRGPVLGLALGRRPAGPMIAALVAEDGVVGLRLVAGSEEEDFLTGESRTVFGESTSLPLPEDAAGPPRFLAISGTGGDIFVGYEDGLLARVRVTPPGEFYLAESGRALPEGRRMTAMGFILGHGTLIWGDDAGELRGGFLVDLDDLEGTGLAEVRRHPDEARRGLAITKDLPGPGAAVTALAPSSRSRLVTAGYADGSYRLFSVTSQAELAGWRGESPDAVRLLAMAPKENGVLSVAGGTFRHWDLDPRYPEAGYRSLLRPVWYEGYPRPQHVWQSSSGTDDFEPKLGLVPLIFGTIKATLYSMMFGAPLALLAAVFTSEFLDRRSRSLVKPTIELMASLPSVVLGFLAALVFAPFVERLLATVLASFFTMPLAFLLGAYLWQLLPSSQAVRLRRWRFLFHLAVVPAAALLALAAGPLLEQMLFAGDLRAWLAWSPGAPGADPRSPLRSTFGGWLLLLLPVAGVVVAMLQARLVNPRLRRAGVGWSRRRLGVIDLAKYAAAILATLALAAALAWLLGVFGFDPRGGLVDTYVQRNAMVVGFVMGFAIIPIIYTIAEDALSTVPEHLRSASLGAGATPWQTAVRIVIPTAMSGLFSALMVGLGRAVGETMIVLMAAGNTPVMTWNIFEGFRTLSANIAVELPEAVRNSAHYRTLFLAALALFAMTFVVNTVAEVVRLRFRRRAYQL